MSRPPAHELSTRAITTFLLELHERSHDIGYQELRRFCMDRLVELFPFDAGLLATGTIRSGELHLQDAMVHGRPPEFMDGWRLAKHEDRVAVEAVRSPGRTQNHAVAGPIFDGCEIARAQCRAWGVAQLLFTAQLAPSVGLYSVMCLYRADPERPFSEEERMAKELVTPHVFTATRRARLGQLRGATRLPDTHGHAGAVVDHEGLILEADEALVTLFRAQWPTWSGPWLPPDLVQRFGTSSSCRVALPAIVVRANIADGVRIVHVRRTILADSLTPRELEIAEAFSLGETYRELGARLGIAPNTARRHLANIYEKLGISSKVELDRMLSMRT